MSAKTPEGKIRAKVVKWAVEHGIDYVRMALRPGVRKGVPDDLFLLPNGWSLWIEFKAPGKRPSKLQDAKLKKLIDNHHMAMWTDEPGDALQALTDMLTWRRR